MSVVFESNSNKIFAVIIEMKVSFKQMRLLKSSTEAIDFRVKIKREVNVLLKDPTIYLKLLWRGLLLMI